MMRDNVTMLLDDRVKATWAIGILTAAAASAQPRTSDVVVAAVERRPLPNTMKLVATVEPLTRSLLASEIAGIVEDMPVRQGDLVKTGDLIVRLNGDSLRWGLAEAEATLGAARARLMQWEFETERIKKLYGDSQANEREVYNTRAEHDVARFEVIEQEARVDRLRTDLAKTEIKASIPGYVVRRETEVGEWVDRGGAVVELVDLSGVLIRVGVPESAMPFITPGDTCPVFVDALQREFRGSVRHIIRQADPEARTFPVEITVDNADRSLGAGMFARATIISGPKTDVVAVPKDAIVEREGIRYVAMVIPGEDGKMGVLSPVTTGADVGEWIAITSGNLREGTEVVIRGNERMFPFPSPIRVVDRVGRPVDPAPTDTPGGHEGHSR